MKFSLFLVVKRGTAPLGTNWSCPQIYMENTSIFDYVYLNWFILQQTNRLAKVNISFYIIKIHFYCSDNGFV